MGALSIDLYKQEREYGHLTLSDANVVKYLILYRSKVDVTYGMSANVDIYQAGDAFIFNQELIALYTSLDTLIKDIKIKDKDREFLNLIFEGHEVSDIIELFQYPRKTAYRTLIRVTNKIVEANHESWKLAIRKQGL